MNLILLMDLTLRGSLVLLAALIADQIWAGKITAGWRRVWWLLVPVAFLLPISLTPPALTHYSAPLQTAFDGHVLVNVAALTAPWTAVPSGALAKSSAFAFWIGLVWLTGAIVSALLVVIPTWKVHRQWSTKRLSTDPALLNLLEDIKVAAGVTAPIGLVISDEIAAPALLGWLRPRILLPTDWASTGSPGELRAVLLHELAHFKLLDIPLNWLFASVRVIHWFNPLAWLASAAWARFREEAADENAIHCMCESTGTAYGEVLLKTLGKCPGGPAPYGALAIGESIENLKRRMHMICRYHSKSNRGWMASAVILTLGALMTLSPTLAGDDNQDAEKKDAVAAMQAWLGEMDAGSYAQAWSDAAKLFQAAVSSDKWVTVSKNVRTPLGKLVSRKLSSALYQSGQLSTTVDGTFVVAQFDSSFENLTAARETVSFQKEADGTWRAAGYYIKPR